MRPKSSYLNNVNLGLQSKIALVLYATFLMFRTPYKGHFNHG